MLPRVRHTERPVDGDGAERRGANHRVLQEVGVIGGNPSFGHYRLKTTVASDDTCTITATVVAKWRAGPPASKRGRVRLGADDELIVRNHGRHGAVSWWAGRRGGFDTSALGSQRLPAALAKGLRRHADIRVTTQHFAEVPQDFDACLALGRAVTT